MKKPIIAFILTGFVISVSAQYNTENDIHYWNLRTKNI